MIKGIDENKGASDLKSTLTHLGLISLALIIIGWLGVIKSPLATEDEINPIMFYAISAFELVAPYILALGKLIISATLVAFIVDNVLSKHKMKAVEDESAARREQFEQIIKTQNDLLAQREDLYEKLMDRNSQTVLTSVYKRFIPEAAFIEVEKVLLQQKVERRNYRMEIALEPIPKTENINGIDLNSYFLLAMHSSYRLHNLTNEDLDTHVKFGIEIPNENKLKNLTKISSLTIDGNEMVSANNIEATEHACIISVPVKIPAHDCISATMEGVTVKRRVDSEIWASVIPSDGVVITLTAPEGVDIQCKANHSQQLKLLPGSLRSNRKTYHLPFGIIPYQSIVAWWNGENITD